MMAAAAERINEAAMRNLIDAADAPSNHEETDAAYSASGIAKSKRKWHPFSSPGWKPSSASYLPTSSALKPAHEARFCKSNKLRSATSCDDAYMKAHADTKGRWRSKESTTQRGTKRAPHARFWATPCTMYREKLAIDKHQNWEFVSE